MCFLEEYSKEGKPIDVNFRELVDEINGQDRYTHLIHKYPAKLLPHIPHFFLNNDILCPDGGVVLDPFSGSGTVMLETVLSRKISYGVDANPLARLISRVKVTKYSSKELLKTLDKLILQIPGRKSKKFPSVVNIDYWYYPEIKNDLTNVLSCINEIKDENIRDFFLLCLSNCAQRMSLADPRVSVPVRIKLSNHNEKHPFYKQSLSRLNSLKNIKVIDKFIEICHDNIKRNQTLNDQTIGNGKIVSDDAKNIINPNCEDFCGLDEGSVDLIITSPPYAGAQKYIRSSSLSLGWTQLANSNELRVLDSKSIGRENYRKHEYALLNSTGIANADKILEDIYKNNPLRAHIAANYLQEMTCAIKEFYKVLKPNGYFVLIIANNKVCGRDFETQDYLREVSEINGFKVKCKLIDDIKSYGLMTKRNKTANVITREWILIFQK